MANSYRVMGHPLAALDLNFKALKAFPYDARFRVQLSLTLAAVARKYWKQIRFQDGAEDQIHRIAMSAGPDNPAVLLSRAMILINYGRADEAQPILDRLNSTHPRQVEKIRISPWLN